MKYPFHASRAYAVTGSHSSGRGPVGPCYDSYSPNRCPSKPFTCPSSLNSLCRNPVVLSAQTATRIEHPVLVARQSQRPPAQRFGPLSCPDWKIFAVYKRSSRDPPDRRPYPPQQWGGTGVLCHHLQARGSGSGVRLCSAKKSRGTASFSVWRSS